MANHKAPADRFDIQVKVYLNDHLQGVARKLASSSKGFSEFVRDLINFAWLRYQGGVHVVPTAAPYPAYTVNKKGEASLLSDHLVAMPYFEWKHDKEMLGLYADGFRVACNENAELKYVLNKLTDNKARETILALRSLKAACDEGQA
jgi:hypothetical protein